MAGHHRLCDQRYQVWVRLETRESLPQVDRPMLLRQSGHGREYGGSDVGEAGLDWWHWGGLGTRILTLKWPNLGQDNLPLFYKDLFRINLLQSQMLLPPKQSAKTSLCPPPPGA